jgi:hypothetical protein
VFEEEMLIMGIEDDIDDVDLDLPVAVKCPFCPRQFQGDRDDVEESLFDHLWKVHEEKALEYILTHMYISPELREKIFTDMGPEYVSWLVDVNGEIIE